MRLLLLLIVCVMVGCGTRTARIDGSSPERLKESIAAVRESLPESEREAFDKDVMVVGMSDNGTPAMLANSMNLASKTPIEERMRKNLDGKAAAELRREADELRAKAQASESEGLAKVDAIRQDNIAALEREIAELTKKKNENSQARQKLGLIEIVDASAIKAGTEASKFAPALSLKVRNWLDRAIAKLGVRIVVTSPGREVPWITESMSLEIDGGINPGETRDLTCLFIEFAAHQDRDNLTVSVTPTYAYGANETELVPSPFDDSELEIAQKQLAIWKGK